MPAIHWLGVGCVALALIAAPAVAADPLASEVSLAFQADEPVAETTEVTTTESTMGCPVTFDLTYSLYSDYIFRGINFSDWPGEGAEALNHQITTGLGFDLAQLFGREPGAWGTFSFETFWEIYADQEKLDPVNGGQNLQEIDWTISWSYPIEPIYTDFTIGWTYYVFENLGHALQANNDPNDDDDDETNEWFINLDHNDAWMWKWLWPDNEDGVLNPSLFLAHDVGIAAGDAVWVELTLSHEFPIMDKLTLTPSWALAVDHNWYANLGGAPDGDTTRLANMTLGFDASYDLTELLRIPEDWGSVALGGFLYYTEALGTAEHHGVIDDQFYGGMSIGYSFGG